MTTFIFILLALFGIVLIAAGILLAHHFKQKLWYLITAFGALTFLGSLVMIMCAVLLINGIR